MRLIETITKLAAIAISREAYNHQTARTAQIDVVCTEVGDVGSSEIQLYMGVRNFFCEFSLAYGRFTAGYVIDKDVSLNYPIGGSGIFEVKLVGDCEHGSKFEVEVTTDAGVVLTPTTQSPKGLHYTYDLTGVTSFNSYNIKVSFVPDTVKNANCYLTSITSGIEGAYTVLTEEEEEEQIIIPEEGIEITELIPYSEDPSSVRMGFTFVDINNKFPILKSRTAYYVQYQIRVTPTAESGVAGLNACFVPVGEDNWQTIFSGKTTVSHYEGPNPNWVTYNFEAKSPWVVMENDTTYTAINCINLPFETLGGETTGVNQPWKVTTMLKSLLRIGGFDDQYINLAAFDDETRLFYGKDSDSSYINPGANLAQTFMKFKKDYLPHIFFWDHAIEKFNLILPSDYRVAVPILELDNSGVTGAVGLTPAFMIKTFWPVITPPVEKLPYLKEGYSNQPIPPEFNLLIVTATGEINAKTDLTVSSVCVFNPFSSNFNFMGITNFVPIASRGTDWLGNIVPVFYYSSTIEIFGKDSGLAATIMARRIYRYAGVGRRSIKRVTPMPLFPHETDPTKFRTVRMEDPVSENGVTYIVKEVVHSPIKKTNMAMISLVAETNTSDENVLELEETP